VSASLQGNFYPLNRFNPGLPGYLRKLYRSTEIIVVGNGQGWHFHFHRPLYQILNLTGSIQKGKRAMTMQVNKLIHTPYLLISIIGLIQKPPLAAKVQKYFPYAVIMTEQAVKSLFTFPLPPATGIFPNFHYFTDPQA